MSKIIHYSLNNPRLLPSGYTPLQWIEINNGQYIDIGIADSITQSYYVKCITTGSTGAVFGNYNDSKGVILYAGGNTRHCGTNMYTIPDMLKVQVQDIYFTPTTVNVNGNLYNLSTGATATRNANILLGKSSVHAGATNKLYKFTLWDNGILKRDLYPAKNSSNVAGMFDLVEQKFYSSATSTAFIAGPEVPIGLPAEYTPVEWIKTGSTTTTCTNAAITCYRNSDMMPGIYTRANATPFAEKSGYILGPTTRDEGREWNNVCGQNFIDSSIENWAWTKNASYSNGMSWTKNGNQVDLKNSTAQTNASALGVYRSHPVYKEATYSWSVEVKASAATNNVRIGTGTFNITTSWQRVSMSTKPTGTTSAFCVYVANWPTSLTISLRNVKLEYGSIATPYGVENPALLSPLCKWSISQPNTSDSYNEGSTEFNSSNSYAIINNLPTFNNVSFSFWIKPTNTSQTGTVFTYRGDNGSDFAIFLIGGKIRFDAGGQTTFNYSHTTEWQHICVTYNKVKKCLYVNGVLQQEVGLTTAINCIGTLGTIGVSSNNGKITTNNALQATLKDFMIFDHALSRDEILQIM